MSLIDWPGEPSEYEKYTPECLRVHEVLRAWADAIEGGYAEMRYPDSKGRTWTEEQLEAFLAELDTYVGAQMGWANNQDTRRKGGPAFDAGPGYLRLAYPQRLALAQELQAALDPPSVAIP